MRYLVKNKLIFLLLLIAIHLTALSQLHASPALVADTTDHPVINVGVYGHRGFIIPHSQDIRNVADSNPWGISLDISIQFTDSAAWQYMHAYPRLGVSLAYYNFDNPDVLGNGYALIAYVEPFLAAHKQFNLSFRLGSGIVYLNNVYDPEINPDNLFYSTKVSFPLVANLMVNYRFSDRILLRVGATYKHISNGGIRQPNKGINFPSATIGFDYALQPAYFPERLPLTTTSAARTRSYLFALLGTMKDRTDIPTDKLPVLGFTAYASQGISQLSALTAGAEWIADFTLRNDLKQEHTGKDFQRGALLAGHEFLIGRFRFSQQLGVYVYAPEPARDPVYQRYGLEYHTDKKLYGGINLKAHRHVADFLDIRIGLKFP